MLYRWDRLGAAVLCAGYLGLAGCGGGSEEANSQALRNGQGVLISGVVLDGPVVGADIEVIAADGVVVSQAVADSAAAFSAIVPPNTLYPITLRATGGTNLVTSRPPEFPLEAQVTGPDQTTVNLSPFSTALARLTACSTGKPNQRMLAKARDAVLEGVGMGFDGPRVGDPWSTPLDADNAADFVLASEAFTETVRRTVAALNAAGHAVAGSDVVAAVGCDLADDGELDGDGDGTARRLTASFRATSAGVLLELIAKQLRIDGVDAMDTLDASIDTILPGQVPRRVREIPPSETAVRQARHALTLILGQAVPGEANGYAPARYVAVLDQVAMADLAVTVSARLDASDVAELADAVGTVSASNDEDLALIHKQGGRSPAPLLSFAADAVDIAQGASARLSWAAANAQACWASGAWDGAQPQSGSYETPSLTQSARFVLTCSGPGGTIARAVAISVAGSAPPASPVVVLTSSAAAVEPGASVTLQWSSAGVSECSAGGAWSGVRHSQGTAVVGPLQSTQLYTLTCAGPGGSMSDGVIVSVRTAPPPPAAVSTSLTAAPAWVNPGESTWLSWTSAGATSCAASGGWSASQSANGSVRVGPLTSDRTYSLACSGPGGNAVASTTVSLRQARLSWQPPAQGAQQDVAAIRILQATAPGAYSGPGVLVDPALSRYEMTLAPGTHYFTIVPVDSTGRDGSRSNEASKTIE